MDRIDLYDQEQGREQDVLIAEANKLLALGLLEQFMIGGSTATLITGLTGSNSGGLTITMNAGQIYKFTTLDNGTNAWGPFAANLNNSAPFNGSPGVMQQGYYYSGTAPASGSFTITPPSAGKSQWYLISVGFGWQDSTPVYDPANTGSGSGTPRVTTGGVILPFYNPSNPTVPYQGQNNSGNALNTSRQAIAKIYITAGTAVTTGTETPPAIPNDDTGTATIPLYWFNVASGASTFTMQLASGTITGANAPSSSAIPTLAGFLNAHHNGTQGQAPKINLSAAAEVQGVLPVANMTVTNGTPSGGSDITTTIQKPSTFYITASPPSSSTTLVANVGDTAFCTTTAQFYCCTAGGTGAAATWIQAASPSPTVVAAATTTYTIPNTIGTFLINSAATGTTGRNVTLPTVADGGTAKVVITKADTVGNPLIVGPDGTHTISFLPGGATTVSITGQGQTLTFEYVPTQVNSPNKTWIVY